MANGNGTRTVPAEALHCSVGSFELGDNGEDAKTAPFRMVARSGEAIDHWWWGKVVHDLAGMRLHKARLPIDYVHDDGQVIGYASNFNSSSGDLVVSGALVPYRKGDIASEIIHKAKAGVPYEASINFGGEGIVVEEHSEGAEIEVNGRQFAGPITVIRKWPLRGIAVCPYGADMHTSTEFSQGKTVEVEVMAQPLKKSEEIKLTEAVAEAAPAVEATSVDDKPAEGSEPVEAAATEPPAPAESLTHAGPDYLARFGDRGGVWFAQGKTWAECLELERDQMAAEIVALRTELAALKAEGERSPINFQPEATPERRSGLAGRIRIVGRAK